MKRFWTPLGASLMMLALGGTCLWAGERERKTVETAGEVLHTLSSGPNKGIPHALVRDARAVAVIPHVVKAGVLLDHRFGRGVLLVHQPNGAWSNPVFITLEGGGIGLQAGVESTDMVLVFKTENSLEHILRGKGKLNLGRDVAVAVGHLGKEVEVTGVGKRKPEVYAYSRSRGLFAGVSVEGDRVLVDGKANESFYNHHGIHPAEIMTLRGMPAIVAVENLKGQLMRLSSPNVPLPPPAVIVVPRKAAPPAPPPPIRW